MSAELHDRQDGDKEKQDRNNVLLYHSGFPVLRVEQGTTFGLIKILYESIGGHAQIIGLRQRQSVYALPCFITHDQTIVTEREYDIIFDAQTNLLRSERRNRPCNDNERRYSLVKPQIRQEEVPMTSNLEYGASRKEAKIDWVDPKNQCTTNISPSKFSTGRPRWVIHYSPSQNPPQSYNDQNGNVRVVSPCGSTFSSTTSIESPKASGQDLPDKVTQRQSRNKPKWQCLYCKKVLQCRSAYNNHLRTHTGEKPFRCDVCGRRFGNHGNLKQHLHIHRDVKPHICNVCGRGFTRANRLRDHRRLHQQEYELYLYRRGSVVNFARRATEYRAEDGPVSR